MAVSSVVGVLLITVIVRCEPMLDSYSYRNEASQFGELLRPPPPPPLSIHPVPFHGAPVRSAHQSGDISYQYQVPPPPPPLPPMTAPSDFKPPTPFYRQYNFNFVPQPQPFTTTPSPTMFQKVSQWLFPSQQISDDMNNSPSSYNIPQKKDCNPCNFAPWIPVIRYDVTKNHDNPKPVYGVPNPSGSNILNSVQNVPQRFNKNSDPNQFSTDGSHDTYGLPKQTFGESNIFSSPSSTYGPPSHTVTISHTIPSVNPFVSSSYDISSNSYSSPLSNHNTPNGYSSLTSSSSIYITQSSTLAPSISNYNEHSSSQRLPNQNYVEFSTTVNPSHDFQLPKVEQPTQFKNSYGEPIANSYALDIPYPVSSTGAESHKVNTEVLPDSKPLSYTPNVSLSNPAPFSLNKGRNIHTLQPVALPNLSVSPLPPIFNARPFRPFAPKYSIHSSKGNDQLEQHINNLNIAKSIPIAEFVHSVEYPATVIQSPVIDIDTNKINNQTKSYRNIPNNFIIDDFRDISPQASEDHISAANSHPDASFESTGADYGSDLYDSGLANELKQMSVPSNHNPVFADLRGLEDEDIDKYRTESNLQHIDSPLLYLKPNAPHKSFSTFITPSTPRNMNEYEIYDEAVTTPVPQDTTLTSAWDESRMFYAQDSQEKLSNINRAKVVQIIIPYTNADQEKETKYNDREWPYNLEKDFQARKVQTQTESSFSNKPTVSYESSSTTELPTPAVTEYYNSENINTQPNDQFNVKEAPFDIIRLQHTIDAWTQQEYTKDYKAPNKTRPSEKYAKQIPDDFLTTLSPLTTPTDNYNNKYDLYDHEGSSSIQYTVRHNKTNNISPKPFMQYNTIERSKTNHDSGKNDELREIQKLHIYTAASKFRKLTTPPPWGHIQTSISPLTKEKVYVVTSKPWREKSNFSNEHESKVQSRSNDPDDMPFKSPRFSNRPPMGEQSDVFTKGWHQIINNLESRMFTGSSSFEDTSKEEGEENEESKTESQS